MKTAQDYLKNLPDVSPAVMAAIAKAQRDAYSEGYREAADQMLAIATRRSATISRIADHARRAA